MEKSKISFKNFKNQKMQKYEKFKIFKRKQKCKNPKMSEKYPK